LGVVLRWIEIVCSDEGVHRSRVDARGVDIPGFYVVTWVDVQRRLAETEAWKEERLLIDTLAPEDANLSRAIAYLGSE
jgi:hypothetical protein